MLDEKNVKTAEIDDDELDTVAGGAGCTTNTVMADCPKCQKKMKFRCYSGGRGICEVCGTQIFL